MKHFSAILMIPLVLYLIFLFIAHTTGCGNPYAPNTGSSTATSSSSASPSPSGTGSQIVTLASSLRSPSSLALYGDLVFWCDFYDKAIYKINKSGGAVQTVANSGLNYPFVIAISNNFIYIGEADPTQPNSQVNNIKKFGVSVSGSPTVLYNGQYAVGGINVDANNVYWTEYILATVATGGTVKRADLNGGGTVYTMKSGLNNPGGIALNNNYLFFNEEGTSPDGITSAADGTVQKMSVGGGSNLILGSGLRDPTSVTASTQNVYFPEAGTLTGSTVLGTVNKASQIVGGYSPLVTNANRITKVFFDSSNNYVYYNEGAGIVGTSGFIKKVSIAGGTPLVVADGQSTPGDLVTDSAYVYWIEADWSGNNATIKRAPK